MNKKIVDGVIAIIMLMDDLGQSRISNQTGRLIPQEGGKNIAKHILNVNLDMNQEITKPNPKRITITHSLGRQNIQPKALHHGDEVGVPEQEVMVLAIRGNSMEDLFPLVHIKLPELKAT